MFLRQLRPAIFLVISLALLTGLVYPLVVTGIAQMIFPHQAQGSLVTFEGRIVGSELIGQEFVAPDDFWGRLSATSPAAYNSASSLGSNLGPLNPIRGVAARQRLVALKAVDPNNQLPVPGDLVTSSGSGLDPDISLAAAQYQAERVARVRNLGLDEVQALILRSVEPRQFGLLGEPRVKVLKLNLALRERQSDG